MFRLFPISLVIVGVFVAPQILDMVEMISGIADQLNAVSAKIAAIGNR